MKLKSAFLMSFIFFSGFNLFCQSESFLKGEDLFKKNQSREAIAYLKEAARSENNPKAYIYLSIAYYQNGLYEESLDICKEAMNIPETDKKIISFNGGNSAFLMGDFSVAEEWYSKAIEEDSSYAEPYLNRANARLKLAKYKDAQVDYIKYLELAPEDVQRDKISMMIKKLSDEVASKERADTLKLADEAATLEQEARIVKALKELEEEKERLKNLENLKIEEIARQKEESERQKEAAVQQKEETNRLFEERIAEQNRLRDEADAEKAKQKAIEDAERRKRLLEEVTASLQQSQTENMSAGAEGTVDYEYESELE